jgi:hypothetical protein
MKFLEIYSMWQIWSSLIFFLISKLEIEGIL